MKMTRIPYLRAVSTDKRLTPIAIEADPTGVCDAFGEAGLLSDHEMKAAAVVDSNGRYSLTAVDAALAKFPIVARIEIKNTLARSSLL
jgi:hypothetical protein